MSPELAYVNNMALKRSLFQRKMTRVPEELGSSEAAAHASIAAAGRRIGEGGDGNWPEIPSDAYSFWFRTASKGCNWAQSALIMGETVIAL